MPQDQTIDCSPSLVHHHLMDAIQPAMRYEGGDVVLWQRRLRRKLRELTGYVNMPRQKAPLNPRTLWRREHELGSIEKLVFTSEEGADVPAYFCLPREARGKVPAFICLQGHSTGMHNSIAVAADDETTPIVPEGDRGFAIGCLQRGIAALCIEQRAFAQRRETRLEVPGGHLTCQTAAMHALMLGRTLAGERVYDVDRGIDYLATRPEVNLKHLGVMGNSGGGLISILSGALLPRIRSMIPSCGFCTYRDSIMSIHHCVDNYIPSILLHAEMADVLGLFAPRPVVVVAGKDDPIFPIAGVREAFADLQRIYAAADAADQCRLVIGDGGHRFYADIAWQAMRPYLP